MKTLKCLLLGILLIVLSSCSQRLYKIGHVYRFADNKEQAYYKAGGHDLSKRHEINSKALVTKSQYTDMTYEIDAGFVLIKNNESNIYVYYGNQFFIIEKGTPSKREWSATVNGKKKVMVIEVSRSKAYGRLYENGLIVGRYTF